MRHHNEDFVKFHEKVSVRALCAAKFKHFRKDQAMRSTKTLAILVLIVCTTNLSNAAPMGTAFTYQGRLMDANSPADGRYDFEFKLFDDPCTGIRQGNIIEVNDLDVIDGYFTTELDFGGTVFNGDARWLQISVRFGAGIDGNDFATLIPRQQITTTPYAAYAGNNAKYAQVVTVAVSGGDYTSVQAAIDSITDANENKPYLLWVAPGVYNESVTMKPYVHLQGSGQEATVITSSVSSSSYPPTQGTMMLSHHTSLRDLTVVSNGTGVYNTAILTTTGTKEMLVTDVTAKAQGQGALNYAIFINGSGTSVTLQGVNALSENGSNSNYGLHNYNNAVVTLRGGAFNARGGGSAYGIANVDAEMDAEYVTALAENSNNNYGLYNSSGANANLLGGSFTARGGTMTYGIHNTFNNTTLEANNINALAENGSSNYGLYNHNRADAKLIGGSYTARGGTTSYGIRNTSNNPTLEANNINALAENGGTNYGLYNDDAISDVTQSVLESQNYSAYRSSGTLTISNSRLIGGPCGGSVACVAVSRGTTFNASGCP